MAMALVVGRDRCEELVVGAAGGPAARPRGAAAGGELVGDELFAGYDKYLVEQRERRYRHIPAPLRTMLGAVGARMNEGTKGRR